LRIVSQSRQDYRTFGYRNICCLTDEDDDMVTPEHCELITVTKVPLSLSRASLSLLSQLSSRAIEGTLAIIDKVVQFIEVAPPPPPLPARVTHSALQNLATRKYGCSISVRESVPRLS
jgi:hypothetical protein